MSSRLPSVVLTFSWGNLYFFCSELVCLDFDDNNIQILINYVRTIRWLVDLESKKSTIKFYTDIVNSAIFGTPVSYLQKYPDIDNYSTIVNAED